MKSFNTRIAALLFAAVLAISLVGCSRGSGQSADTAANAENVCFISIECSTAFSEKSELKDSVAAYLPPDGIILAETGIAFGDGESVADVLRRVCEENGVALETTAAPLYGSIYVEGIGNLYEFDCGPGSGWMYCVNGVFPNYGASSYVLSPGDRVEWRYTCDFGEDIGGAKAH